MAFLISSLIDRLRTKVDLVEDVKDTLTQDGTSYTIVLTKKPIVSGSDSVYISHTTNTTGYYQYVPRNYTQDPTYLSGNNLTYTINLSRGEINMYRGSGYIIGSGLNPFAPWNTSTVTVYYQASKYSDNVLASYLSYAVAAVETSLQMGMYVSGLSGIIAPNYRYPTDMVDKKGTTPYGLDEIYVIADDVEIVQELIAQKALYDILARERRIGAGNAIKIVDGDTQIDTSVNQRYLVDLLRDTKKDYNDLLKWIMYNMGEGYSLRQINESSPTYGSDGNPYIYHPGE